MVHRDPPVERSEGPSEYPTEEVPGQPPLTRQPKHNREIVDQCDEPENEEGRVGAAPVLIFGNPGETLTPGVLPPY